MSEILGTEFGKDTVVSRGVVGRERVGMAFSHLFYIYL